MNRPSLHPELAPVLVEALRRSEKPLSVIALRKQIYPPFRFSERDRRPVEELLAEQAKEGRIYEWPRYRRQRQFWIEQPEEFAARAIIRRLERGACSRTALEKDVRGKLHGFPKSRWPQFIKRLLDEGRIFQNPPWKTKGRTKLQASPPDPEPYLKKLVPELRKLVERFVALRVSPQPWVDEVWGKVTPPEVATDSQAERAATDQAPERATTQPGKEAEQEERPEAPPPPGLPDRILAAIERLEPNPGAAVTVERIRRDPDLVRVDKEPFDQAVLHLVKSGLVDPHRHSGPFRLSEEERSRLAYDGRANYYVALVKR